jgi:hypothetical protein
MSLEIVLIILQAEASFSAGMVVLAAITDLPDKLLVSKGRDLNQQEFTAERPSLAWVARIADSIGCLTALLAFPALGVSFSHLDAHPDLGLFLLPVVTGSAFHLSVALVEILGRVSPQWDNKRADPIFRVGANVRHYGLARLILLVLTALPVAMLVIVFRIK